MMRVDALSETLGVSAVTIRADLAYLEEQGLVVRSSGTARPALANTGAAATGMSELSQSDARAVLRLAASLVLDEATILLGPGLLPTQLVASLPPEPGLILMSLDAAALARRFTDGPVWLLGGQLGPDGNAIEGPQAVSALSLHTIGMFFFQADALVGDRLLLPPGASEPIHRAAVRQASHTVALIDGGHRAHAAGPAGLPAASVGHVILSAEPSARTARALADGGFQRMGPPDGPAQLYGKAPDGPAEPHTKAASPWSR